MKADSDGGTSGSDTSGTEVTVRQEGIPEAIPPEDANAGWNDSLGNLAALVEDA